ncbi:hypothetical protein FACS189460_0920 [Deltaproteobacteria bacterium]|nr:hypothetical protein FACS189460_0920 [Deltaproteobacteria bacterium]
MLFSFARLEALETDASEIEETSSGSPLERLEVPEAIKEEIQEIIEEAVEETTKIITEAEIALDEAESAASRVEETVEQTESLLLLYKVIQEHGVSAPVIQLIDANGSFRQAVRRSNPRVSFEGLSNTPDYGELKVACESAILENLQKGVKAVQEFIRKLVAKIRAWFLQTGELCGSYARQIQAAREKLGDISAESSKKVVFKARLTGQDFEKLAQHYAKLTSSFAAAAANLAKEAERELVAADEEQLADILLKLKEKLAQAFSGSVEDGRYKAQIQTKLLAVGSEKSSGWSLGLVKAQGRHVEQIALNLARQRNIGQQIAKPLDDLGLQIQHLARKNERSTAKVITALGQLASFVAHAYLAEMNGVKMVILTWLMAARAYIQAESGKNGA